MSCPPFRSLSNARLIWHHRKWYGGMYPVPGDSLPEARIPPCRRVVMALENCVQKACATETLRAWLAGWKNVFLGAVNTSQSCRSFSGHLCPICHAFYFKGEGVIVCHIGEFGDVLETVWTSVRVPWDERVASRQLATVSGSSILGRLRSGRAAKLRCESLGTSFTCTSAALTLSSCWVVKNRLRRGAWQRCSALAGLVYVR
jgi:hypothetical protein